jgi:hypothetical protein
VEGPYNIEYLLYGAFPIGDSLVKETIQHPNKSKYCAVGEAENLEKSRH